jgi:hypothetical protein
MLLMVKVMPLILGTGEVLDWLGNFNSLRSYLEMFTAAFVANVS